MSEIEDTIVPERVAEEYVDDTSAVATTDRQ
jgi:hypothetical protein